ncbi:MAG: hypothetical protein KF878_17440 [Planctomycetes bacterium]|nr:hypothetical protein [Planctomycetota bacterium]
MANRTLVDAVVQLGQVVEDLSARVAALEAARADLERKTEVVQAAQRSWRPLMRVQGDLMIASEAGDTARVPLSVCRALAAGRALDLDVAHEGELVRLVDHGGRAVATLPRVALLALPRVLGSPEASKLLGATTTTGVGCRSRSRTTGTTRRESAENRTTGSVPRRNSSTTTGPDFRGQEA